MFSQNSIKKITGLNLKAMFFDMDGVLFDSMPNHAKAWTKALKTLGVDFNEYDAYMREGMTGEGTISEIFESRMGRPATHEECEKIYAIKSKIFESFPEAKVIPGVKDVLEKVKKRKLDIYLVTGSGQKTLIDKLNLNFPGIFQKQKMITAYDVTKGKPDPEPYLMALKKGGFAPNEAIVIENAPLGVLSAHRANIFTIAVNTGILKDEELLNNGADLLFPSMDALSDNLDYIFSLAIK